MYCLGIESTAHTFGISIVERYSRKVFSNVRDMFRSESGGLIPVELSEHHVAVWESVLHSAIERAGISLSDISLIAYSRSPGLGHALRIGSIVARCLSLRLGVPLVGVNHCIAHLEVGRVHSGFADPVLLYASGANTQIIALEEGLYRVFGETIDLGVGNFLDSVARFLGLGFPGGPALERLAAEYSGPLLPLPYSVKGMDVSFSGMQTAVRSLLSSHSPQAIAFSVQEHAFALLVEVSERALAHTGKQSLVLGGGVACNQRLSSMCQRMCSVRGVSCFIPDKEFLVDNGAMIALLGIRHAEKNLFIPVSQAGIDPYERTDEVSSLHQ